MRFITLFLAVIAHPLYSSTTLASRMERQKEVFPLVTKNSAAITAPELYTILPSLNRHLPKNPKYLAHYLFADTLSIGSPQLGELLAIFSQLSISRYSKRLAILTPQQYGAFALSQSQNSYFLLTQTLPVYCLNDFNGSHKFTLVPQWLTYSHQKKSYLPDYQSHTSGFSFIHTYQDVERLYNITPMNRITYLHTFTKWIKKMGKATTQNFYYHPSLSFAVRESFIPTITFLFGYNYHWIRRGIFIDRPISASTTFSTWEIAESLDLLYQYFFHSLTLLPELNLTQTNVFQNSIHEKQTKGLHFQIEKKIFSYLDILFTLKIQRQKISLEACMTPSLTLGWHRAIQLSNRFLSSKLEDFPSSTSHFITKTYAAIPHSLFIQPRLDLSYKKDAAISLSWRTEYGNKRWSSSLVWQFSWSF